MSLPTQSRGFCAHKTPLSSEYRGVLLVFAFSWDLVALCLFRGRKSAPPTHLLLLLSVPIPQSSWAREFPTCGSSGRDEGPG